MDRRSVRDLRQDIDDHGMAQLTDLLAAPQAPTHERGLVLAGG
jgi:hypothetical protein